MSVFLRWGVFGILGVAALLYAYNASKRLAEAQTAQPPASVAAPVTVTESPAAAESKSAAGADAATADDSPAVAPAQVQSIPAQCAAELAVAERAIQLRNEGAPLDRVLRMQEIAWEESDARRLRLEEVARRWHGYEGNFRPETLRSAVLNSCRQAAAAP